MIWVAIAVVGFAAWLSVVVFFVALCSAAARADRRANAPAVAATAKVIEFSALRQLHQRRTGEPARRASAFG